MGKAGTITNQIVDAFPASTKEGSGLKGPRETDVDVAIKAYVDGGANGILVLIDYNKESIKDEAGVETGEEVAVDDAVARARASGRIAPLKARGYNEANGYVVRARNGAVYVKYFVGGVVPDEYLPKVKAVGEALPV